MKYTRLFSLISICALSTIGCSLFSKEETQTKSQIQQNKIIKEFEAGNELLDQNRNEEAAVVFDRLIVDNPVNNLDLLITYNSGLAHLLTLNCEVAAERFRKVVRAAAKDAPAVRGRALLRMGDVYTCLGDDSKAVTTLFEILNGKFDLPFEIIRAEIPAKLASAYARMGNRKEADKYFRMAEKGLVQVETRYRNPQERIQALGMTLFLMGNISSLNVQTLSSDEYFSTVKTLQRYLYRAVELNATPWALQASDQIEQIYRNTWSYIERAEPRVTDEEKSTVYERDLKLEKNKIAQRALDSLKALFNERIPDKNEPQGVRHLIQKAKIEEAKIRNYLATNTVGTDLTEEAKSAASIKRPGRVENPNPVLENEALKKKKSE